MFCTTSTTSGLPANRLIWVYGPQACPDVSRRSVTCDIPSPTLPKLSSPWCPQTTPSRSSAGTLPAHPWARRMHPLWGRAVLHSCSCPCQAPHSAEEDAPVTACG